MHPLITQFECSYVYLLQLDLFQTYQLLNSPKHLSVTIRVLLALALLWHVSHSHLIISRHLGHHPVPSLLRLHTSLLRLHSRSTVVSYISA